MADLRTLQLRFAAHLNTADDEAILSSIVGDEKASATERMGFYHDAYRLRLIEVMQSDYPGLYRWLGDEQFASLVRAYLKVCPSRYRSIRWFGVNLPAFIQTHLSHHADADRLYEMALFEKQQNDVFDEADIEPMSVETLASVAPEDWGGLHFSFVPACRLVSLHYQVPQLWRALQDASEGESGAEQLSFGDAGDAVAWLVWRKQLNPHWRALAGDEVAALSMMMAGENFAMVCEALAEVLPEEDVPERAVMILRALIDDGVIAGLTLNQAEPEQAESHTP